MTDDKMRAAFEAWAESQLGGALWAKGHEWEAWQAAIASQAQEMAALRAQVHRLQDEVRYWNDRITAEGPQFGPEDWAQ